VGMISPDHVLTPAPIVDYVIARAWNVPPRSLRSPPPGGSVSRSGRPFPT